MLVKRIDCAVRRENRDAFAQSQCGWRAVADVDGFIAQIGGWLRNDPHHAVILAFWQDRDAYDRFKARDHDRILNQIGQGGTWDSINVSLWNWHDPSEAARPWTTFEINIPCVIRLRHTIIKGEDEALKRAFRPGFIEAILRKTNLDAIHCRHVSDPRQILAIAVETRQNVRSPLQTDYTTPEGAPIIISTDECVVDPVSDWLVRP